MSDKDLSELDYIAEHEMSRRDFLMDMLAGGGLAAGSMLPGMAFGAGQMQVPKDEVVRIGYLPITDATALLVAMAWDFSRKRV